MTLLGQGRQAEVFGMPDGCVLKLLRNADHQPAADREAAALAALAQRDGPVPRVRGRISVDGRPGLVLDRVDGPDLLTLVGSRPWLLARAGRVLAAVHARLHTQVAPEALPDLHAELGARIGSAPNLPADLASWALSVLNGLPSGNALCHGDLHLGNILGGFAAPVVIDWAEAARGDPVADIANTWLLHRMGQPPPGIPLHVRVLAPVVRGVVVSSYLSGYGRRRAFDRDAFRRWQVVRVAARFHTGIEEEVDVLTAWLRARHRRR